MVERVLRSLAALAFAGAVACGERAPGVDATTSVVASFYPLYEAASRVAGDAADVVNLTAPGVEPHEMELTTAQLDRVLDADVVLHVGGGFQPALEDALGRARGDVVDVLEGLPVTGSPAHGGEPEDGDHAHSGTRDERPDPHVWLDPSLMARIVDRVAEALAAADRGGRAGYLERAAAYREEIEALDAELRDGLARCRRTLVVVNHASFGYLTRRYGLEQRAISGLSPEAEPNPERLAELADLVESAGVTTVFTERLASPDVARALAREAGVRTAVLDPVEGLTARDARAGKTYATIMRENLAALREALSCT